MSTKGVHSSKKRERLRTLRSIPTSSQPTPSTSATASSLHVPPFLAARSTELKAMATAIHTSKNASSQQAFQTLPRHLKRRAASWNVRRVPERMRERARREMEHKRIGSKIKKKQKRGKDLDRWTKRQVGKKAWLNSHLWHAKRMHMVDLWGYRLALKPTEKTHRSTYRASAHGCTLHDASYTSVLEMTSTPSSLRSLMQVIMDPADARAISGKVWNHVMMYRCKQFPKGCIGPVKMIWETVTEKKEAEGEIQIQRVLFLMHPVLSQEVAHQILVAGLPNTTIRPITHEIGILELGGARALEVLDACVIPSVHDPFWEVVRKMNVVDVPRGTAMEILIRDPRFNFPPKLKDAKERENPKDFQKVFCDMSRFQSQIWSSKIRMKGPGISKKEVDEMRAKELLPNKPLIPSTASPCPLLLLFSNTSQPKISIIHPRAWTMPLFHSIVHLQPRVLGLENVRHVCLEFGHRAYPEDWVVEGYREDEVGRSKWEKRGRGKCELPKGLGEREGDPFEVWPLGRKRATRKEKEDEMEVEEDASKKDTKKKGDPAEEPIWIASRVVKHSSDGSPIEIEDLNPPLTASELSRAIVPVQLSPLSRGVIEPYAYIYSMIDPLKFKDSSSKTGWKDTIQVSPESTSASLLEEIGRVTSGGYIMSAGKGGGLGFVKVEHWKEGAPCVVRNRENPVGRVCRMLMAPSF